MGFQDMVSHDMASTFLNDEFFGEIVDVAGKPIPVVVDNDQLKQLQGGTNLGIEESNMLFFCRVEDLPEGLTAGSFLNVNHRQCIVDDVQSDMGLATVILRENILG